MPRYGNVQGGILLLSSVSVIHGATIAQNDCGANMYEVAFGMNHSHGFNITRGYVKIDFTSMGT